MKEGFLYVLKQPFILKAMLLATLLNLILTPLFVVKIYYVTSDYAE